MLMGEPHYPGAPRPERSTTSWMMSGNYCCMDDVTQLSSPASTPSPAAAAATTSRDEIGDQELRGASSSEESSTSTSQPGVRQADHWSRQRTGEDELCLICGDRASGYHYNALSCEGCKGFFRRSVTRGAAYTCKYGGRCEMDMWMRRKCQACRLLRCRNVGMREECLLSEGQCVARNARRQQVPKKPRRRHRISVVSARDDDECVTMVEAAPVLRHDSCSPPMCPSPLDELGDDHRHLISLLVTYQDRFELPTDEDVRRVGEMNILASLSNGTEADVIFGHMVEMAIVVTRLVVEFAKHLPGFDTICKDDQITLLKGSSSEVMVLRAARRYDPETDTVVLGDGNPFSPTMMAVAHCGLQDFVDAMFAFSRTMASLGVDNAEYALLISICIFSDRAGLRGLRAIDRVQSVYTDALIAYVRRRRVDSGRFLAKLLMKLVDLRSVNALHTDCLYRLTVTKGSLPPLLQEYFDISPPLAGSHDRVPGPSRDS